MQVAVTSLSARRCDRLVVCSSRASTCDVLSCVSSAIMARLSLDSVWFSFLSATSVVFVSLTSFSSHSLRLRVISNDSFNALISFMALSLTFNSNNISANHRRARRNAVTNFAQLGVFFLHHTHGCCGLLQNVVLAFALRLQQVRTRLQHLQLALERSHSEEHMHT